MEKRIEETLETKEFPPERFNMIYMNSYDIHLDNVYSKFTRDQVHVMIFEEWTQDVPNAMKRLYEFIGVSSNFSSANWGRVHNSIADYERGFLNRMGRMLGLNGGRQERGPTYALPDELRRRLCQRLDATVRNTEAILARDLSIWNLV